MWSPSAVAQAVPNPGGVPTLNTFTADNLLVSVLEPVDVAVDGRRWTGYGYDPMGRKRAETVAMVTGATQGSLGTPGDGATIGYSYSPQGWPLTDTGRTGSVIARIYDPAGNMTGVSDFTNGWTLTVADYFLNGRVRTAGTSEIGVTGYLYTGYRYHGDGVEMARVFDDNINMGSPEAFQFYSYGDARSLTSVLQWGWGQDLRTWNYTNDTAGRPVTQVGPSAPADLGTQLTTWAWNPDGTLENQTLHAGVTAATAVSDRWAYTYDAYDRIATRTRTGNSGPGLAEAYTYDPAGRLTGWAGQTFGYDHNSNRTSAAGATTTYRADNSIAVAAGQAFAYHPFGGVQNDGARTYGYDGFGRLAVDLVVCS